MSNKILIILLSVLLFVMGLLLIVNLSTVLISTENIPYYEVRGMATEWNGKLWTLNFEQQNQVISILRNAEKVDKVRGRTSNFMFTKLIIYLFDQPDSILKPLTLDGERLIFSINNEIFAERNPGELQNLLSTTYD